MIEAVGYSQDGQVWIRLAMEIHGEKLMGTLLMTPELARQVAMDLETASDNALAAEQHEVTIQ